MASVELREVSKSFGQLTVIEDVSVSMADGEFVVLVGPSGCGKSTLLRMICGLEDVSGGGVFIGDRKVNDLRPKDRDIAMVFQSYALYPHMTVAENMGFSMRLRGVPRAKINERVIEAADMLNLQSLTDRFPRQLSGGQRQRVAMGRAMVRDPEVFLFDEPLSNLDAKMRVQMRSEIKELHQRLGTTIVYVTHDQVEAMTLADKIVVMRDGAVEQVGAPLDLYDQPSNVFVAGFIGSPAMNFIRGSVDLTDGAPRLTLAAADSLQLPEIAFTASVREVIVGIRPEHIRISDHGVEATVASVEPMGSETQVNFSIGTHALVGIFRERIKLTRGEIVRLSADAANIHIFDAGSERRL